MNNVDKSLNYGYPIDPQADLTADDIEIEMGGEEVATNVMLMEDGSAEVGEFDDEESELPPITEVPHTSNLVAYFDDEELTQIANDIITNWESDNEDRAEWHETYEKGLELLGMKMEDRDEPFEGASGVHHPLLAEAVVQFQAQAYKELLPPGGPVLTKVLGSKTPERVSQAERVKNYMNYSTMERMDDYDEDMDRLLLYLPLGGSAFKKVYFDPVKNKECSVFITADHVTVPSTARALSSSPRVTHDFVLSGNAILKYQDTGFYSDTHALPESGKVTVKTKGDEKTAELMGITNESNFETDDEYLLLESHLDLQHEVLGDEIARPYIVTLDKESGTVLAIRKNWKEGDELMEKLNHFVHYKFLPGLGFYGFGLIHLIGGLTKAVTGILRQLMDAGTFSNLPGGLKAKGLRVAGEDTPIAPGEWRDVDASGGNLRDSLMPLPYKEPSMVLFQLLGMLTESGQRFASIADMQVGDTSGQQQPVGTTIAMLERGTKVMSSIHKRLHNAQKNEFRILGRIIHENMQEGQQYPYSVEGEEQYVLKADFDDRVDIIPVSDPNIFSMAQRIMLASQQLQMAQAAPEVHNVREAYRRMYVAMGISDIDTILKPEEKPQRVTPMMEHQKVLMNQKLVAVQDMDHQSHIEAHLLMLKHPIIAGNMEFASNLMQDIMGHLAFIAKKQSAQQAPQQQLPQQPGMPGGMQQLPQQGMPQPPQQAPNSAAAELALFNQLMPQMMPQQQEDPIAQLQKRQLDITEQFNEGKLQVDEFKTKMKTIVDMAEISAKERMAEAINNIKIEDTILNARVDLSKTAATTVDRQQMPTNNSR